MFQDQCLVTGSACFERGEALSIANPLLECQEEVAVVKAVRTETREQNMCLLQFPELTRRGTIKITKGPVGRVGNVMKRSRGKRK